MAKPQDDGCSDRSGPNKDEIALVKQQWTGEQKQRFRAERHVESFKKKLGASEATREDLKRKNHKCEATRLAQRKKLLRADISALELKETSALNVASTSSKILDDATRKVIRNKSESV